MPFTSNNAYSYRKNTVSRLKKDFFDVIIIGGGVTGAGIALDAASRGLKVALIEKNDFASGTSSKSTKLVHGGLRYLKQYEFALVREVGKERATVHKLATHLVRPEKMLLPLIKDGNYGKIITSVGLMVYDVLADVESEDQRKMLTVSETLQTEPLLNKATLEGGGLYSEYQTDDFRLVVELVKQAQQHGASVLNYTACDKFLEKGGKICGISAYDSIAEESFNIYGDYVINAGGPWADDIRGKQEKVKGKKLHLTKGVHLVVPHSRLPIKQSVYFDVSDGRMIFAIPKKDITYIGTTDTNYVGDPKNAKVTKDDANYLINAANNNFPTANLTIRDIVSSWSGIRPLIAEEDKSASEISRKDEIFVSDKGLITIAGGKLTGYRQMAKRAVNKFLELRNTTSSIHKTLKCKTRKIKLAGNGFKNYKAVQKYKLKLAESFPKQSNREISYLVDLYGDQSEEILSDANKTDETNLIRSELHFCIEKEMILHLTDFFIHRTGRLFFDIQSVHEQMTFVAKEMQVQFDWSDQQLTNEISILTEAVQTATTFE